MKILEVYIIKDIVNSNDQENLKIVSLACMASDSIKIEPFKTKKIRHTFSSTLFQEGVPIECIVEQMDHKGITNKYIKFHEVNDLVKIKPNPALIE